MEDEMDTENKNEESLDKGEKNVNKKKKMEN